MAATHVSRIVKIRKRDPGVNDISSIIELNAPQSPARQRRTGLGCGGQRQFEVRARDQIRLKVWPSSSANSLDTPFARAVFIMFLVSEVHPFVDGNGRIAPIMKRAELVAAGESCCRSAARNAFGPAQ